MGVVWVVITSYSIHYTKLYDSAENFIGFIVFDLFRLNGMIQNNYFRKMSNPPELTNNYLYYACVFYNILFIPITASV